MENTYVFLDEGYISKVVKHLYGIPYPKYDIKKFTLLLIFCGIIFSTSLYVDQIIKSEPKKDLIEDPIVKLDKYRQGDPKDRLEDMMTPMNPADNYDDGLEDYSTDDRIDPRDDSQFNDELRRQLEALDNYSSMLEDFLDEEEDDEDEEEEEEEDFNFK